MRTTQQTPNRLLALAALAFTLAPLSGRSQVQPAQTNQQTQLTPAQQNALLLRQQQAAALQRQQQAAALQRQQQLNGANRTPAAQNGAANQVNQPNQANQANPSNQANPQRFNLSNLLNGGNANGNANANTANAARTATPNHAANQRQAPQNNSASPAATRIATINANRATAPSGRPVPSRTFAGSPGPAGSTEATRNGNTVRTAADGSILDVHSPRNGMYIHHGVDGSKSIMVDRPDHSRVYASSRGLQYVQHPYVFQGHSYDHRTFVVNGQVFHRMYRPYTYRGTTLDVYASTRYYAPNMYQWVNTRASTPQNFTWPYTSNPPAWYGHYRGYFTPDASYTTPTAWLADYVLAASLMGSYKIESAAGQPAPPDASAPITPEVKKMLADEVGRQVQQESVEAQQVSQNHEPAAAASSVVQELQDKQTHVFVVAADLDLVDPSGRRCMVSEGDVVQVVSEPKSDGAAVDAVVMASKGGVECERAAKVEIALNDVQEMQNHMRDTIDQGMADTNAGKQAAKITPAFAASPPPADNSAASEIEQQQQIAAAAES
jgi:hypothetical protein